MQQNTGNFLCKMIARKIHHFFFSFTLILLLGVAPAHSAGYTCDSSKVYTSCNANYFLDNGQCKPCPSGYPYSAGGTGGITSCYSATKSRAWTGSQVNGSVPANCASVTAWDSCSKSSCTYVAYSNSAGTGDGTIKSGCSSNSESCTKTPKTVTASANAYVSGNACYTCTSFNSSYPYSDGGSISSGYCYRSLSKTGSQLDPTLPTGCAAQSTTACTPGTCSYKDYYNATDTTCTPSNCTKTHSACTSASTNYYLASGVAKTCSSYSSSYPSSAGGNITYSSCFGSFSKSGSQLSCSTPSGCASVTCGTCTPGTCTYTKYASGTIKSDCTPSDCTKPVASVTASANNYVSGTSCPTCTSYNSSYPYSDGGSISYTSCFKNVTKTGSQNACSKPANSVSYACNSCTPGTCTYRDYNGATDGTCTPTDCTQTVKSATCSANYYGTTSCAACSLFNSSYPYSDQGTTSSNYCYASKTNTGSQNACTKPDNCYSVTCNSCTPGTCSWRDYYNATDTTCTPTNCNQTVKSVTANANYFVDGTSCKACNTVGDKTYTASAAGNSGGSGVCYKSCTRACTQQSTPTGAYSVTHGTTSTSGTHYYGGSCSAAASTCSLTVNSCAATYYKNGNACSLCSSLSSAYPNSSNGNSSGTGACYASCAAGTRVQARNAACTTPAGNWYTAAHTVYYGSVSPVNYCMENWTSSSTSASGHDAKTDCTRTISGGQYVPTTTISARYVRFTGSSTNSVNPYGPHIVEIQAFASADGSGTNLLSGITSSTGSKKATDGLWDTNTYDQGTNIIWDLGATQSLGSIKFAPYVGDGRTYYNIAIAVSTDKSTWTNVLGPIDIVTEGGSTATPRLVVLSAVPTSCISGTFKASASLALGSTSSCTVCGTGEYSDSGAASCSACATAKGYTNSGTTAASHAGVASCKASCSGAQYVATAGAGCVSVGNGYWGVGGTVAQNTTLGRTLCPQYYRDGAAASSESGCVASCGGGTWVSSAKAACTDVTSGYWREAHTVNYGSTDTRNTCPPTASGSDSGRDSKTDCYVSCSAKTINNGTTTVVNAKEYYSGSAYPACTYNVNCNPKFGASGNKTTNPACTVCATGQYSAGGTNACADCKGRPDNSGYTSNASSVSGCLWECNDGYNLTSDNQCGQFCTSGITHIHLGNGLTVPLYSSARTSPAINVKWKDSICYGSLATGQSSGALNVKVGSAIYHATN